MAETELLFLDDAYAPSMDATVLEVRDEADTADGDSGNGNGSGVAVALDRTVFYATSGGQPHDVGTLQSADDGSELAVVDVRKQGDLVWHWLTAANGDTASIPASVSVGSKVTGTIDWERRHQLMRTHTSLHILCGVIWNEWEVYVTGGNMEPLSARMDFEFGTLPENFSQHLTDLVNQEIAADRPIEISYLDRSAAAADRDLIRTKVNLVPESVKRLRIVDIVGLDKQADGGTHVASTSEVGRFEITKTESKGKGNKRVRIALHD